MDTGFFSIIDNNIFAILILLLVIVNMFVGKRADSTSGRIMLFLCLSTLVVLFVDMTAWIGMSISGRAGYLTVYISNFLLFLLNPLPPVVWLLYVLVNLYDRPLTSRQKVYLYTPLYLNIILMIYSFFSGFVFTVDEFNVYHRGPGVLVVALIDYSTILATLVFTYIQRNSVSRKLMAVTASFCILPLSGSLLQIFFYGISASWPFMAIGIVLTYIFMEIQKNIRDPLTGLINRQQYEDIIQNKSRKTGVAGKFSLIVLDMNHFKEINDNYGHDAGDRALQAAALLFTRSVSMKDTVVRLGGDEFVILLDSSDPALPDIVIKRIQNNIDTWNSSSEEPFHLSVSAGYSLCDSENCSDPKEMFVVADAMMYMNKKASRSS